MTEIQHGELALREKIAALVLKLERSNAGVTDAPSNAWSTDRLRLRARVQALEQERSRLQTAVTGWKREAGMVRRRRTQHEAEIEARHQQEERHATDEYDMGAPPEEGSLAEISDIHANSNVSVQPRWMDDADGPTDPEPPQP